ncbi:hypothetical protein GOBAR_DD10656 [Gossypium barbadense]|nr:hypothetical protein GOBAR_DD10656 [Gossypium barbadense]
MLTCQPYPRMFVPLFSTASHQVDFYGVGVDLMVRCHWRGGDSVLERVAKVGERKRGFWLSVERNRVYVKGVLEDSLLHSFVGFGRNCTDIANPRHLDNNSRRSKYQQQVSYGPSIGELIC